ncbi:MAG TPA: enoyl-[acyl-carrier-protein] reductase FabK, partial [Ruminococcus sp.]|nr:enoyl-[acyl-carrier-protein] reductase FabK [Ruminococcus sp.]
EYAPEATAESIADLGAGSLRRAAVEGDVKTGSVLAGQISGMINKEQTCEEIINEIMQDAENILKGAEKWVK